MSVSLQLLLVGSIAALPSPQLTAEDFKSRGRSLGEEDQDVFITDSYTQVRRQGRMGAKDNIKFPTLEVRDPNELAGRHSQNSLFAAGPVYKKSTADIEEKIREINAALDAKIEAEEEKFKEKLMAMEIAEDLDVISDMAADIVTKEIIQDIDEMVNLKIPVSLLEEEAEAIAEDLVLSELGEMEAEIMEKAVAEAEAEVKDNIIDDGALLETSDNPTMAAPEDTEEEGSGKLPTIDFGDITEVSS